ncbi:MAG: double-strand break repair protein AddB [Alphaproteobacteria bacterium]|nr:double-strand break repair protein AddB [Alphaproteobacteria bacterium]
MATADIFAAAMPRIFTIDPGRPFLEDLSRALHDSIKRRSDLDLADAVIYLPTRRAARTLSEALLATAPSAHPILLPQIRTLGDIDEDELIAFSGAPADEIELPPAISLVERRLVLARMVAARDRAFDGQERWAGALAAGDELGKLLDSFYTEEVSPDALHSLAPEALADHWQHSLKFLSIVTESWPQYLIECELTDPAERRVKLIDAQAALWRDTPPAHPVIIAGTTGSTPAVARMMKIVAELPLGCVILPGLDTTSDARIWEAIGRNGGHTHPQSGLRRLLDSLEIERSDVAPWPASGDNATQGRNDIIAVSLRPADASDSWRDWARAIKVNPGALEDNLTQMELVEARDEEREAASIAIKIRSIIEAPSKTVMLVTPDRDLARRVSVKLRRWNINVDDSAGVPFPNSPCGVFLRLVAIWLREPENTVALLSVLRHPLFGGNLNGRDRSQAINSIDLALRGLKPNPGATGLRDKINTRAKNETKTTPIIELLSTAIETWPRHADFPTRLATHLSIAEQLCATPEMPGDKRLWRGEDGDTGAQALAQLMEVAGAITHDEPHDYPEIFRQLVQNVVVRRHAPAHPRINILGPLEARLQHADFVILGGLNEGVWPRDAAIDPFLSRPMRRDLGLPSPEQRIGLAAHDFAQLTAAPAIMLTRSTRAGGKPTKPSRWIVRLKNILTGADAINLIDRTHAYETLAAKLDAPEQMTFDKAPQPKPPLDARPTKFFVTQIEKLLRDPYAVYARYILRLKKLDEHNEPFDARHIGNLFHQILESFAKAPPEPTHAARITLLQSLFGQFAPDHGLTEEHLAFWRLRSKEAFEWAAKWDADRRALGKPAIIEGKGAWGFDIDGQSFTLSARADRIDLLSDGSAFIIDYKTGTPPPTNLQAKKFSPQLPLTGLIVANGGFDELGPTPVSGFQYIRIVSRSGKKTDDAGADGAKCAEMITNAETGLRELLLHFSDPSTPYPSQPRPQYTDDFGDYDHLARRRERNAQGGDE